MAKTRGAVSSIPVKLAQLMQVLRPDAIVYISSKQAKQLGLTTPVIQVSGEKVSSKAPIEIREVL